MELADAFLVRTLFLLTPGIVACRIAAALRGSAYERAWEALVDSLMLSALGYVIAALALSHPPVKALEAFVDTDANIDWAFISVASVASALVALVFVAMDSRNGFQRIGSWLKLTNRVSNTDVWSLFLEEGTHEWHFVRDHTRGLLFYGHIHAYSESEKKREIWMETVRVYDDTTDPVTPLYDADDLYWAGSSENATLETPSEKIDAQEH